MKLIRDKLGLKSVYYFIQEGELYHSDKLTDLLKLKKEIEINKEQIGLYKRWGHFPADTTIIKGIKKLLPGHELTYENGNLKIKKYWDIYFEEISQDLDFWKKRFIKLFTKSIEDSKPKAVFLSGGLDSSCIASIASKINKIKTFSIGDIEAKYARKVAEHLGTEHKEVELGNIEKHFSNIIKNLDEPISNVAMIPYYFLAKEASKSVNSVLTGSGGDELFAGYMHYKIINLAVKNKFLIKLTKPFSNFVGEVNKYTKFLTKITSKNQNPQTLFENLRLNSEETILPLKEIFDENWSLINKLITVDLKYMLPDNYALIEKNMIKAHNLKVMAPLLSDSMLILSLSMPTKFKLNNYTGKYIMRKSMAKYLPKEIINRKKVGFATPFADWWRDYFQTEMENLMPEVKKLGIYNYEETVKLLESAKKGEHSAINKLFPRLILHSWIKQEVQK